MSKQFTKINAARTVIEEFREQVDKINSTDDDSLRSDMLNDAIDDLEMMLTRLL